MGLLLLAISALAADESAAAYQRSVDAVVYIAAVDRDWNVSTGTGVVVDARKGLILTAFHVVGTDRLAVATPPIREKDGRLVTDADRYHGTKENMPCRVIARDAARDLALLQWLKAPEDARALPIASRSASPGEEIFTIGSAAPAMWRFSGGNVRQVYPDRWTFAGGQQVSARVVEMTVPINPGDSGGPVISRAGEVVGINSAIWKDANQVQKAIDVVEIRAFLSEHPIK